MIEYIRFYLTNFEKSNFVDLWKEEPYILQKEKNRVNLEGIGKTVGSRAVHRELIENMGMRHSLGYSSLMNE